jgi:catechol 2,3-dioxygenase-like lactoylglutathione lyase family enzyme
MRIHRLDHLHIYSADPESSARFYRDVFKADAIGDAQSSQGHTMHFLRLGGLTLVVAPYPPGIEPGVPAVYGNGMYQHGFGVAHFGLHVGDVKEAVESVRRLGGTILSEPRENAGLRFAYIGGPDGVIIELLEYTGRWGALLGASPPARPGRRRPHRAGADAGNPGGEPPLRAASLAAPEAP